MKHFLTQFGLSVGLASYATVGSPSGDRRNSRLKHIAFMLLFLLGSLNVWGADVVVTLDNIGAGLTSTANTTAATTDITATGTTDSYTLNYYQCKKQGNAMFMTSGQSPFISNHTAMPGNIKSIEVFINTGASGQTTYDCKFSTTECNSAASGIGAVNITSGNSHTYSNLTGNNINVEGKYFCITLGNAKNGQVLKLVITCEGTGEDVAVTGVSLNKTSTSIEATQKEALEATITPNDATNKNVTWESSNESIATVDENGVVTAIAVGGPVTITCKSVADNTKTATCAVTVTEHVVAAGTYNVTLNNALFGSEASGSLNGEALHDYTGKQNDITFNYVKGSGTSMYMNASQIRLYKNVTLVVSAPAGYNITEVTGLVANIAANVGSISNNTWTGQSNSITFSFTATSGNAQLGAISVTYEAVAPEVTVDPTSLSFDAKQNIDVEGKTFTLTGANLSSGLTLAASAGFNVSPESITAADAMAQGGVEVTVTPTTPTATTTPVGGTVTISGGGLTDNVVVNLSMAVTPTYAVALAVNDNAMGSATINGGAGPVYAEYAEDVTLVATANPGYEFVNWTVSTEDIDLGEDAEKANGAVAAIGAAGTITANFQTQACKNPKAPTLNGAVAVTYNSATINWNAVTQDTNDDAIAEDGIKGYLLNITKHDDGSAVLTDEMIEDALTFTKNGLLANTQYDFTIMAYGDDQSYCLTSNPTFAGSFTTSDYPAATLSLVENGGTPYNWGSNLKMNDVIALPAELAGLGCSGKVLVGWTNDENFADTDDDPTGEDYYWAKGANYTIASSADKLYAVLATESGSAATSYQKVTTNEFDATADYVIGAENDVPELCYFYQHGDVNTNAWGKMASDQTPLILKLSGTASALVAKVGDNYIAPVSKNFKVSSTSATFILNDDGKLTATISSKSYYLRYNYSSNNQYGLRWYDAETTGNPANLYKVIPGSVSYSAYTTSCSAALPKLDAPVFGGIEEGVYYEAQNNITLSSETEGATIYFVIDEEEITEQNRIEYTVGAISLSDYGVHTVKAIAVKDGYENSDVATATYTIGKTFASVSALFSYLDENSLTSLNNVKVSGLVSQIKSIDPSKYINGQYYISDNGQQENELYLYNGKYINGVNFTVDPACPLEVGDAVTVIGNYMVNSNTRELAAGNYIVTRTAAEVASITIDGSANKTTYSEEDNIFSYSGLTATATYNTGYEKDVTAVAEWSNDLEDNIVSEAGNVTVTASWGGKNDTKVVAVSYTTKTVKSIRLEYASTYTFVGFDLPKPKVYASYVEDIPEEEVTELLTDDNYDTEDAYNKSEAGDYIIKVGYKSKEATYTVTVKAIYNTQETAHSVADAIEIIKKSTYTSTSADPTAMYVRGFVCTTGTPNNNGQLTYYINDTEEEEGRLQVYQGKYFENASFDSNNNLAKGDEVIIEGHMLYYNSATPELKASPLVYLLKKALPTISVENVAELEVGQADLDVTELITKQGNGVVSLESGDLEKLTVDGLTLHAVGAADVTVTANLAATANEGSVNYKANSTTFTVHVIAARTRYTVTFDANGADGGSAPEAIVNQLEGATVELPECTYTWAHHGFTGWKVINLSTSAEIEIENNQFTMPAANVKIQAQWEEIATTHIVFNVNGNTETVAAVDVPQAVEYSITQVTDGQNGYEFVGWAESPETEDVEEAIATIESYTPGAGEASKTLYAVFKRVDEGALKTDVLTADDLAATSTTYTDFSNVSKTSNAVYAGNSAKNSAGSIQLRSKNNNSGIVTTSTGGILKSVVINVGSGSATIDVYGSNTAYSTASDLYGATQGTKIGSTSTTNTIDAAADYKYVGIRANDNTIYLSSVEITWQPKTTYYTTAPSAVYAVSYVLGEGGAWEGEACDGANVKAGQTFDICESVPVREHYKFVKWQVADEDVSGTITINAATAITAVWEAKVENNITYNAGTGSGSDAVDGSNEEGAEIILPSAAEKSLSKDGYDFVGWLYGGDLYEAGTTFEMPASAVTFVAQWKKQNITKMTLVTDVAQLVDGGKVVIAQAEITDNTCKTMGAQNTNNRSAVASTVSGNVLSVGEGTSEFTLVSLGNNLFAFQASNGSYLYAASSGNNYLREQAAIDGNASWTISIASNGVATIKAQGSNTNNWMRYNSGSTLFSCYGSGQQDIAIYASVTAITDTENPVAISDLGYVEGDVIVVNSGVELEMDAPSAPASITVKDGATVTISAATEADNLIVENGGKVTVSNSTTVNDLFIGSTMASGKSGQIDGATNSNFEAAGDVYFDLTLGAGGTSAQWHAFTVPFPVDALNGVYDLDGNKLTNEVNYAIMDYHGDIRAEDKYGWKKYRGVLVPGTFYLMTVDGERTTYRFKKVAGADIVAGNTKQLHKYASSIGNNNNGWNGVGNPTLMYGQVAYKAQVLNPASYTYEAFNENETNFIVGTPFFIQATEDGTMTFAAASGSANYAPARQASNEIKDVKVTFGNEEFRDKLYISASEDALNEYETGKDLVKMTMTSTPKVAQIFGEAYNAKLCMVNTPMVNDQAEVALSLYAPTAGEYTIAAPEETNAYVYLTKDGVIIWNLSMGEYTADFAKGNNAGYGIRIVKAPNATTGIGNAEAGEAGVQKVVIDNNVYILRGEKMYDATGRMVK